jgi:hypothetical protein
MTEEIRSKFVGEAKPISYKEATLKRQAIETDYSVQKKHAVG